MISIPGSHRMLSQTLDRHFVSLKLESFLIYLRSQPHLGSHFSQICGRIFFMGVFHRPFRRNTIRRKCLDCGLILDYKSTIFSTFKSGLTKYFLFSVGSSWKRMIILSTKILISLSSSLAWKFIMIFFC